MKYNMVQKKVGQKVSFFLLAALTVCFTQLSWAKGGTVDFPLAKPLLVIKEEKGFLACAYINIETCNKTGEACAIVSGVNTHDDMKKAKIVGVSNEAAKLGIEVGETGESALFKLGATK